jgi:hypothetical protein
MAAERQCVHSEIGAAVYGGRPLEGELVIDAHTHMGPWFNFHIPENDAAAMVRAMDRVSIDLAVCSPHRAIGHDYLGGNEEVIRAEDEHPGRFVAYITINPNYPEFEIAAEIERWAQAGRIKAFKIHPSVCQYPADGAKFAPVWEYANEHGLPLLSHSGTSGHGNVQQLADLGKRYPNVKVLVAHAASDWAMIDASCDLAAQQENLYLDLTGSPLFLGALETMVGRVGADRVLFGSDMPFIDPRPGIGRIAFSRLSDDDKRKILGLNAKGVFGLDI